MNLNRIYRISFPVLLSLLVFPSVQAQIRLAALGGVHSANFIQKNSIPGFDTAAGNYYSPKTGFELGVIAEIPLGKDNLFIQPGILYSSKGNQYERYFDSAFYQSDTLYSQHTLNLNYVELPIYITWKIPFKKNGKNFFYLSAGPYFAFIYGATADYQKRVKQDNSGKYLYQSGTEDLPVGNGPGKYKTSDIGIGLKAGLELGSVLIGAYFSRGLTNAYTAEYPSSFHNQVAGGSLGIWLNKVKPPPPLPKDTDKDGTPDTEDSCVSIPGPPRWHGCPVPDTDHDGMNDEQDSCKTVPGPARYQGCPIPDTDHDGINDEADSCITVPGLERYHGCPVPDRDNDGVNDELDKCPDQAGPADNQGCPVVQAAVNTRAKLLATKIMFQVNSTRLIKSSYPAIKELADTLKTNPDLNLLVEGHTDNTGSPAYNQKLSVERAGAIKKALISQGISASRILVKGYGDSRPIAGNDNAEGRARNRRVVCEFQLNNR